MTSLLTAKRLALYTVVAVLSGSAIAPKAQALPQVDPDFHLLQLRHREQDLREGLATPESTPAEASYYNTEPSRESAARSEHTANEAQAPLSLAERRRQSAAQRNK